MIQNFNHQNFEVPNFELDTFVNVDNEDGVREWFIAFQSWSKTTMTETRGYNITGNQVIFCEQRHCIHSHEVKKKQGKNKEVQRSNSSRI